MQERKNECEICFENGGRPLKNREREILVFFTLRLTRGEHVEGVGRFPAFSSFKGKGKQAQIEREIFLFFTQRTRCVF